MIEAHVAGRLDTYQCSRCDTDIEAGVRYLEGAVGYRVLCVECAEELGLDVA